MPRAKILCAVFCLAFALAAPGKALAQYRVTPPSDPATGERYHIERAGGLWKPAPQIMISSEDIGIPGTNVDAVNDLGISARRFGEFRAILRPARKHKLRLHYIPIRYSSDQLVNRDIVFNGIRYRVGLPVKSSLEWNAWRFAYEYDFITRDRWFVGVIAEAKYTDIEVSLSNPLEDGFARARAPIPALGGIARVYVMPNIAVTGEFTGFRLPESIHEDYRGHFFDFDLYGTVNVTDHFGAQVGYRSIDLMYRVEMDSGDVALKGLYFMGILRF
jgi:hypothetical protein